MWSSLKNKKNNLDQSKLGCLRNCPICDSKNSKKIFELENFQFYSDSETLNKQFSIKENICFDCFAIYLNPVYTEYGFQVLFDQAGQSYGVLESHILEQINWLNQRNLLDEGSSILDVGCYDGEFLSKLPNNIFKYGVDIDKPAIEKARKRFNGNSAEFYHGAFEHFEYSGHPPDTIIMFHVLEHVAYPKKVLEKLRNISKKTTNLIVEVPIIQNGFTNDINGFFSIQHSTHFSQNSLRNCLNLSGWEIIEENSMPDYNGYRINAIPRIDYKNDNLPNLENSDWITHLNYLSHWHNALKDVEKKISQINNHQKYIIWGAGAHTEFLFQTTSFFHNKHDIEFLIVDSDTLKQGTKWRGINIVNPEIISNLDTDNIGFLISTYGSQHQIKDLILNFNILEKNIYPLYDKIIQY